MLKASIRACTTTGLLFLLCVAMIGGCSKREKASEEFSPRLTALAEAYSMALMRGNPPTDLASLQQTIEEDATFLESRGIGSFDDLKLSDRDGSTAIEFRFGKDIKGGIFAFESAPVDGKQMVAFERGGTQAMTEAEFTEATQ